jgi:hypothetical protein
MTDNLPVYTRFGREICGDLDQAERCEWWLANGLGGYAVGTVAGTLTRRYHGLLIAPVDPPMGRRLLLAKAEATLIAERLVDLSRRGPNGKIPAFPAGSPFQHDPHWQDPLLFYEYFHGDNGLGQGAAHQTGWTGLLANLVMRRHRKDIPSIGGRRRGLRRRHRYPYPAPYATSRGVGQTTSGGG